MADQALDENSWDNCSTLAADDVYRQRSLANKPIKSLMCSSAFANSSLSPGSIDARDTIGFGSVETEGTCGICIERPKVLMMSSILRAFVSTRVSVAEPILEDVVPNQGIGTGPVPANATASAATPLLFPKFRPDNIALGGGGSAMPCGFVLLASSAQLELADLLPKVSPVESLY